MKIVVNINDEEQRKFIEGLLGETREQFAKSFRELAKNCNSKKDHRKFVSNWVSLAELTYRKNVITEKKGGEV